MTDPTPGTTQARTGTGRPARRRLLRLALWIGYCVLLFEVTAQVFCFFALDLEPFGDDVSTLHFYPGLATIRDNPGDAASFDILFLGGSVMWQWLEHEEPYHLADVSIHGRPVRAHLAALPGHTSLDSLYKLRYLQDIDFDLVVLYQSINEVRTNNVPPEHWRDDYSHYSWYAEVNFFQRHAASIDAGLRSPVLFFHIERALRESLGLQVFVPEEWPGPELSQYGSTVRSARSFEHNIDEMLRITRAHDTPLLLSTFAWYRPPDYDMENYRRPVPAPEAGVYSEFFVLPIELWGSPDNVVRALEVHNEVLESFAGREGVLEVIPMDALIPKDAADFEDICHFTSEGFARFGQHILTACAKRPR